jgi:hypothetical protein
VTPPAHFTVRAHLGKPLGCCLYERDRWFASGSLQQRVSKLSVPLRSHRASGAPNPIAPKGILDPAITPALYEKLLDVNDNTQLNRFNLRNGDPNDVNNLYEKWESLAVVPVFDPAAPHDYFLFIGRDNDLTDGTALYRQGQCRYAHSGLPGDAADLCSAEWQRQGELNRCDARSRFPRSSRGSEWEAQTLNLIARPATRSHGRTGLAAARRGDAVAVA